MSDDDITVYETKHKTKHKPAELDTPRKEALRQLAKLASYWREWSRDYAEDGNAEQAAFKMAVAEDLGAAQDWLARPSIRSAVESDAMQPYVLAGTRCPVVDKEAMLGQCEFAAGHGGPHRTGKWTWTERTKPTPDVKP